jgi:hypothetical protein
VPVFGEKFILPVLATMVTAVVLLNPMKWDWQSRAALFIGVTAIAFLLSHQIHMRNEAIRTGTATSGTNQTQPAHLSGPASTSGDCSPAITGDANKVNAGCEPSSQPKIPASPPDK